MAIFPGIGRTRRARAALDATGRPVHPNTSGTVLGDVDCDDYPLLDGVVVAVDAEIRTVQVRITRVYDDDHQVGDTVTVPAGRFVPHPPRQRQP